MCKECAYQHILQQKQQFVVDQERQRHANEQQTLQRQQDDVRVEMERVQAFERQQAVTGFTGHVPAGVKVETKTGGEVFALGKRTHQTRTDSERHAVKAHLDHKQSELDKPALPSFWVPSLTPSTTTQVQTNASGVCVTTCTAESPPHPITHVSSLDVMV